MSYLSHLLLWLGIMGNTISIIFIIKGSRYQSKRIDFLADKIIKDRRIKLLSSRKLKQI